MCKIRPLFLILIGANSLQVVLSYSNGKVTSACESMTPKHGAATPQNTPKPYQIDTTNISSSSLDEIMVILKANPIPIRGFLLEAEDSQGNRPVGTFTLIDSGQTRLLNCNGKIASAVSHTRNDDKREIRVKWKRPKDGTYTFRATYVQEYSVFWVDELRDPITPTSPTITTTAASTMTASSVTSTPPPKPLPTSSVSYTTPKPLPTSSDSYTTSKPLPTSSVSYTTPKPLPTSSDSYTTSKPLPTDDIGATMPNSPSTTFLTTFSMLIPNHHCYEKSTTTELVNHAMLLMNGCLTKMAYYSHNGHWFQVHVFLMSLFAIVNIIAFIFVFVEGWRTEAHPVLVCAVTFLTFIQIVVTFFRCGRSHELRFIFNLFHRLNALAIVCLIVAAVFTGLGCIEAASPQHMLQKLMGGLVAWEFLFFILQLAMSRWRKRDKDKCSDKAKNVQTVLQVALLAFFSVGNGAFLVVLLERVINKES